MINQDVTVVVTTLVSLSWVGLIALYGIKRYLGPNSPDKTEGGLK